MSFVVAYSFRCDLTPSQILPELNARTKWNWVERDSELWGEYVSATVPPRNTIVKIFPEEDHYVTELKFSDDSLRSDWESASQVLLEQFLSAIGARDIARSSPFTG